MERTRRRIESTSFPLIGTVHRASAPLARRCSTNPFEGLGQRSAAMSGVLPPRSVTFDVHPPVLEERVDNVDQLVLARQVQRRTCHLVD